MVATYATVQGMLEVLDANPELMEALRARILTRELLELPRVVADLAASQSELAASQIRLESALREFMTTTNARLDSLESVVVVMQRDLATTQEDVAEIKRDLGEMKVSVDDIRGRHVEMDLQGRIHGILGTRRMGRVQVVRARYPAVSLPAFCDNVYDSMENGRITDGEYRRVMDTDVIVRVRRRGSDKYGYVAVEASNRLDRDDVDRVDRTRRALAATFPQSEIIAMVYGVEISDEDRRHAESQGVETLLERAY